MHGFDIYFLFLSLFSFCSSLEEQIRERISTASRLSTVAAPILKSSRRRKKTERLTRVLCRLFFVSGLNFPQLLYFLATVKGKNIELQRVPSHSSRNLTADLRYAVISIRERVSIKTVRNNYYRVL